MGHLVRPSMGAALLTDPVAKAQATTSRLLPAAARDRRVTTRAGLQTAGAHPTPEGV
jgi:hypothetical protein